METGKKQKRSKCNEKLKNPVQLFPIPTKKIGKPFLKLTHEVKLTNPKVIVK